MMSRGYAQTYLKTMNGQMVAVFNYAMKYYSLPSNPAVVAGSMGKWNADEMDFWTLDEFERFIAGMDGDPSLLLARVQFFVFHLLPSFYFRECCTKFFP